MDEQSTLRPIVIKSEDRPKQIDAGAAPILQWLKIDDLVVDSRYQRELARANWTNIRKIANNFTWSKFSPVFVSPIEGGKYSIIDGQHRSHAAAMCGFATVPCQIVQMTLEKQAASFAAVNGMVTKVTVWQIFKAALTAKEEWAITLKEIAEEAGCVVRTSNSGPISKKPGEIYGIRVFQKVVQNYKRELVVQSLQCLMETEGYNDSYEMWDTSILAPLLNAMCQRPIPLSNPEFSKALEEFDVWKVVDSITLKNRSRMRVGLPPVAKSVQIEVIILTWIDRKFPAQMLIPSEHGGVE